MPGHSRKRGLGVITARDGNRILAITPNTKQNTIEEALRGLAGLETVCFVTMDMTAHYRAAVQSVLPRAQIIVDPWHVVMLPTEIVQKERKSLVRRSSDKRLAKQHWLIAKRRHDLKAHEKRILDEWLAQYPVLRELYRLKEEFCAIYDLASNSSDAWERYLAWRQSFPKPDDDPKSEASVLAQKVDHAFATFLRTIDNWRPEILAWFDAPKFNGSRPSQAHAENRNRFIKGVYDRSQGMHYETLRRRMVIGSNWPLYLVPKDNPRPEAV